MKVLTEDTIGCDQDLKRDSSKELEAMDLDSEIMECLYYKHVTLVLLPNPKLMANETFLLWKPTCGSQKLASLFSDMPSLRSQLWREVPLRVVGPA
jgi:hypothetical protein